MQGAYHYKSIIILNQNKKVSMKSFLKITFMVALLMLSAVSFAASTPTLESDSDLTCIDNDLSITVSGVKLNTVENLQITYSKEVRKATKHLEISYLVKLVESNIVTSFIIDKVPCTPLVMNLPGLMCGFYEFTGEVDEMDDHIYAQTVQTCVHTGDNEPENFSCTNTAWIEIYIQ